MSRKNINWINAAKAFCVIFVFLRHSENYYGLHLGWFDGLFLTFYVNAFFFVSGYLLFWKQLSVPTIDEPRNVYVLSGGKKLFLNIIYRIVIPSILFSTIEFLPSCLLQGRSIVVGYALYKTIGGGTYWFTSALVVAQLILLMLYYSRKRHLGMATRANCFDIPGYGRYILVV
jgi:fucose 4-O-acetylase-like acetyltransferase